MDQDEVAAKEMGRIKLEEGHGPNGVPSDVQTDGLSSSNIKQEKRSHSSTPAQDGASPRDDNEGTPTSARAPKLTRKSSSKAVARAAALYDDLPNVTSKACAAFQVIPDCLYGSKNLGSTDNDSFDCDCREEWLNGENLACGEDSDCINRATKMECTADAGTCGGSCQNQRFQRREYANVSVIDTEKKGFGLRTDTDLQANDFIFEYIGEVINEPTFRRRMIQYDQEGIKHFYFMSLSKSEFVDATRKGNLGRFCNHSCNPNCYVDKWVVGDKLRMGIFALRKVMAGEELVFNYNVDRYGADPQPCYCGEPNCVGFIGGKTQTERATKLPAATVEALGIDAGDGWDTSVAKKPRKKRPEEEDEEYVNSIQPRGLDEEDARKVMAALVQCKEKWIAVKLLERIQRCEEERVIHCVMRMHAYQIFKTTLNTFNDDTNVVLQVLSILDKFPRLTRNKISDSKIEAAVENLAHSEHEEVAHRSKRLLEDWSKLEVAYRIRRRVYDPSAPQTGFDERRGGQVREEAAQKAPSPKPIDAPKGPRNTAPQRLNGPQFNSARPPPRRTFGPLPQGWFHAKDASGQSYFYDKQGNTTWQRPTQPAGDPTKGAASKAAQEQLQIQNIINRVTKEGTPKQAVQTPNQASTPTKEPKQEKWRSLPVEKQMKIYENTVFPHVKHVLDKFRHKLPKEDLKRLGKDVAKKLVASDYKNKRVNDPSEALTSKQAKKMRQYVHEFLDRAVQKYDARQKEKKAAAGQASEGSNAPKAQMDGKTETPTESTTPRDEPMTQDGSILSDAEDILSPGSAERKRKRDGDVPNSSDATPTDAGRNVKRLKEEDGGSSTPPPPPPPPPATGGPPGAEDEQQQRALKEQEEALIRENEEAQRLEDEAAETKRLEVSADEMQREIDAAKNGKPEVLSH